MENATQEYDEYSNTIDELVKSANDLKESNKAGAIDSIMQSYRNSRNTSDLVELHKQQVDSVFKPRVDQLKSLLDTTQNDFDKQDQQFKREFRDRST